MIELTYRCNMHCTMCQFYQYESSNGQKKHDKMRANEMTLEQIKGIVDQTPANSVITLTGGEPMLRSDFIDIASYAAARRKIHLITNGLLLGEDSASKLLELAPKNAFGKGLVLLEVSIHGIKEHHDSISRHRGAFDKVVENLRRLAQTRKNKAMRYPLLALKVVVLPENLEDLPELHKLAESLELDFYNLMAYQRLEAHSQRLRFDDPSADSQVEHKVSFDDLTLLKRQLKAVIERGKHSNTQVRFTPFSFTPQIMQEYYAGNIDVTACYCMAPWSKVYVSAYGEVFLCPFFMAGNIKDMSLMDAWRSPKSGGFRAKLKQVGAFKGCLGCCNLEVPKKAIINPE